jgi:hypothetical protein
MPDLRREFRKNVRLATHTALGELFIPDEYEECKWVLGKLIFVGRLGTSSGLDQASLHHQQLWVPARSDSRPARSAPAAVLSAQVVAAMVAGWETQGPSTANYRSRANDNSPLGMTGRGGVGNEPWSFSLFYASRVFGVSLLYQSAVRSLNFGFVLAISQSFFSLRQFFSCFSRVMALIASSKLSQYTGRRRCNFP